MYKIILLSLFVGVCKCKVDFSDRSRNFSITLVYHTALLSDEHVVISPFGIWTLMTGIAVGATGNSYKQLRDAFILPTNGKTLIKGYRNLSQTLLSPTTPDVSLSSKNFMFLDEGFHINPAFKATMTYDFNTVIKVLNFKDPNLAARNANNYIANSGGRVTNVLTSEDFSKSRMILSNVISFKGLWKLPFNKTDTTLEPFYGTNGQQTGEVNMMYHKGPFASSIIRELQAYVLEIPYGTDGRYSMLILLPLAKTKVLDMYTNLAKVGLRDIFEKLDADIEEYGLEDVEVKIPRFQISTNVALNMPLQEMGVHDIFDPLLASFGNVTREPLFVSAIVHKADIEVTESGTVASAATTATFADRIAPPVYYANRPFVYFIMEKKTISVIFGGVYSKPTVF